MKSFIIWSFPSVIRMIKPRRIKWAGQVAKKGEKRNTSRLFVGKLEGKRPLGRSRHRWVDNIKMDLRQLGCAGIDLIHLVWIGTSGGLFVNTVMNLQVP
jgi:hypothetical protein